MSGGRWLWCCAVLFFLGLWICSPQARVDAYIAKAPTTLGSMYKESSHIIVVKVEKVDREKNVIVWRKVRAVKGKWPAEIIQQKIGGETPDRQVTAARKYIMAWAEVGKTTVMFAHDSNRWGHTYIDQQWYCGASPDWQSWSMSHGEPLLLKSYSGEAAGLVSAIEAIAAGK